jgi:protein-disulfide isomerase
VVYSTYSKNFHRLSKEAVPVSLILIEGKGYDIEAFRSALETGKAKKRVQEDMTLGNSLHVTGTPTKVINGGIIVGSSPDNPLEQYLGK